MGDDFVAEMGDGIIAYLGNSTVADLGDELSPIWATAFHSWGCLLNLYKLTPFVLVTKIISLSLSLLIVLEICHLSI